jgi:hypothetical protein
MPLLPILLAVAARDLFLPVAGRIHDPLHDIRTTVTVTNPASSEAHATIRFIPVSGTSATLKPLDVVVPPKGSRTVDPFAEEHALGALHITADHPLIANGRIATSTFDAIPSTDAISTAEAARIDGFTFTHAATETNRLYIVETSGDALQYTVILLGAGDKVLSQRIYLIHPFEQHSLDLDHDFPTVAAPNVSVRVRGLNGGGSIVAAAAITKRANGEIVAREMKVTERRVRGLSLSEKLAYAGIALFIVGAALRRRR